MKLRSLICTCLAALTLVSAGCSKIDPDIVFESKEYCFTTDMAAYMIYHTREMLSAEMAAAGVDDSLPLSEQMRADGKSWADYLYDEAADSMGNILLYCEAANMDSYSVHEGMMYKANENVSYMLSSASDAGIDEEEYVRNAFGENVTVKGLTTCMQMMALCEGYEIDLRENETVTDEEAALFADENPDDFLKFDILRYTTGDKTLSDSLSAASSTDEFMDIISGVSGINLTDSDKNGIPDSLEYTVTASSSDSACEFAMADGRAVGDTVVTEPDGNYTVTMIKSLPGRDTTPVWDFRIIYISTESSTDPAGDAASLLEQWKDKKGGETGFANLAARYSDDPTAYYGGKHSGVTKDAMPTADIADWVCDSKRKAGDTTVIPGDNDGAYMVYYVDGNIPTWQYDAKYTIVTERINKKIASMEDDIRKYFVLDEALLRSLIK